MVYNILQSNLFSLHAGQMRSQSKQENVDNILNIYVNFTGWEIHDKPSRAAHLLIWSPSHSRMTAPHPASQPPHTSNLISILAANSCIKCPGHCSLSPQQQKYVSLHFWDEMGWFSYGIRFRTEPEYWKRQAATKHIVHLDLPTNQTQMHTNKQTCLTSANEIILLLF